MIDSDFMIGLSPGDCISVDEIQNWTGFQHWESGYQTGVLLLRATIHQVRKKYDAPEVTLRQKNGALYVCTPLEQFRVAKNRNRCAARKLKGAYRAATTLDRTGFDDQTIRELDLEISVTSFRLAHFSRNSIRRVVENR